jgi:hypothetical protein
MRKHYIAVALIATLAVTASADLTGWNWTGGVISPALTTGEISADAYTLSVDLAPLVVSNGSLSVLTPGDILPHVIAVHDLAVAPLFLGGTYSTSQVDSDGSAVGTVWLLIDPNGGGINPGDFIGLSTATGNIIDLDPDGPGGNPPGTPQTFVGGNISTNIPVIPEPATIGLLAFSTGGICFARRFFVD